MLIPAKKRRKWKNNAEMWKEPGKSVDNENPGCFIKLAKTSSHRNPELCRGRNKCLFIECKSCRKRNGGGLKIYIINQVEFRFPVKR